jgi:polysaccharide biosynthesis protein PslH
VRLLFAKRRLDFPRANGHDLLGYYVMRELGRLGHAVGLATIDPPSREALDGLTLEWCDSVDQVPSAVSATRRTWLENRFASYFGASDAHARGFAEAARRFRADAVIGMGPEIPAYISGIPDVPRIWYSGDEWVSHYTSLVKARDVATWPHLYTAAVWGLYERTFARSLDRIWVVSERERRLMQRWAATDAVDALPNGVDSEYYVPMPADQQRGIVFWGRLDFAPNIQALQWFCSDVWPTLSARFPDAEFRIIGFDPGAEVERLTQVAGVKLSPSLQDLRPLVARYPVVVLPFRSGGGIKNKFLEAASMGKAIVSTRFACAGLRGDPPVTIAESNSDWVTAIRRLWHDPEAARDLGQAGRRWAMREHQWHRTAEDIVRALRRLPVGERAAGASPPLSERDLGATEYLELTKNSQARG